MAGWMACPKCGAPVRFDVPDDMNCSCGWDQNREDERDYRESLKRRCAEQGESYRELLRDLGGDEEAMDSWLRAMEDD